MQNNKPLKIVHITEAWLGGVGNYVKELIEYQASSGNFSGVHLIYSKNQSNIIEGEVPAIMHNYFSSRNPIKFLKIASNIKKIIAQIDPDIIHLHSTFPGVYGRIFKLYKQDGTPISIVFCAHGWSFKQEVAWYKKSIYVMVEKFLAKRTDAIINISLHEHSIAHKYQVTGKSNYLIYTSVRNAKTSNKQPYNIDPNKINIGFIGRFSSAKGLDFLLSNFVKCQREDMAIYIIGVSTDELESKYHLPNIHCLGWVDPKNIDNYLKNLDIVAIPSKWEGFSLTALEAMRNSKALLVSNRSSLPEVVVNGYNGYIFMLEDPDRFIDILRKLDKKNLGQFGQNSYQIYQQCFSGDKCYSEIDRLYWGLMDPPREP